MRGIYGNTGVAEKRVAQGEWSHALVSRASYYYTRKNAVSMVDARGTCPNRDWHFSVGLDVELCLAMDAFLRRFSRPPPAARRFRSRAMTGDLSRETSRVTRRTASTCFQIFSSHLRWSSAHQRCEPRPFAQDGRRWLLSSSPNRICAD